MITRCPNCRSEHVVTLAVGQVWLRTNTGELYVLEQLPQPDEVFAHLRRMDVRPGEPYGCDPGVYCTLWPDHVAQKRWILVTDFQKAAANASVSNC